LQPGQTYTVAQLKAENENLRSTIEAWQAKKQSLEEEEVLEESGIEEELNKRISSNDSKISDLQSQLK
jgi:predicted RNase H-like nuclease (RuvC/YqgF family)